VDGIGRLSCRDARNFKNGGHAAATMISQFGSFKYAFEFQFQSRSGRDIWQYPANASMIDS
ncbi:hypothetical protein ACC687_37760, partial [Rhizobium ruizarguesonis]